MNVFNLQANEPVEIDNCAYTVQDWAYPPGLCIVKLKRISDGLTVRVTDSQLFELLLSRRLRRKAANDNWPEKQPTTRQRKAAHV